MTTTAPSKDEQLIERATKARKLITGAQRKATKVATDPEANRSTRMRAALKVKADALDQAAAILAGKDAA